MNHDLILEITFSSTKLTPATAQEAMDILFSVGAADVFFPTILEQHLIISVLCKEAIKNEILSTLFSLDPNGHLYLKTMERSVLSRSFSKISTVFGPVTNKTAEGFGIMRSKLEYDELAMIARRENLSIPQVKSEIKKGQA